MHPVDSSWRYNIVTMVTTMQLGLAGVRCPALVYEIILRSTFNDTKNAINHTVYVALGTALYASMLYDDGSSRRGVGCTPWMKTSVECNIRCRDARQ
eukprot:1839156-Pleurochrysis_carterae.AAC.1